MPDQVMLQLTEALAKRNWLAHHYFSDRVLNFQTIGGQMRMSEELGEIAKWFRRLHFSLDAFVTEWRKSRGIPDSVIEEMETEMLKEAKSLWE